MADVKPLTGYPSIDKPWLKYYAEDKRDFELPNCSVYEYMVKVNGDNLEATALDYYGNKTTYRDLIGKIDQCADAFSALGVRCGDVVSFCNPTTPEVYIAFYALNKLGAVANMIDPRTNASKIEEFIVGARSRIVFYVDVAYPKLQGILKKSIVERAVCISPADSLPLPLKLGYKLKNRTRPEDRPPQGGKHLKWREFFELGSKGNKFGESYRRPTDAVELPAGIVYTSGTTGVPKGAVLTNGNLLSMVSQYACSDIGWDRNDRFLGIMPPFIAYGLVCGFVVPLCLSMQTTIIPKFEVEEFASYILKHKPQHIMGVPSYIERLTYSDELYGENLEFLKTVIVGGDKMNPKKEVAVNEFLETHGAGCHASKGYGLTEISSAAVFPRCPECNKIGSVGIPLIRNNIKIVDIDTGQELGYNEVGEICLTGPTLIRGYLDNEAEDSIVFKVEDGVRWLHTGDRGRVDEDGVLFFGDRVKRMIVRHDGFKVYPSKIESVISALPGIDSCCVVGIDDVSHEQGQLPFAYVVPSSSREDDLQAIERELAIACQKGLPEYSQPTGFAFISEIPLTSVGKVDYRKLEEAARGTARKSQ